MNKIVPMTTPLPDTATLDARKNKARAWFERLRDDICSAKRLKKACDGAFGEGPPADGLVPACCDEDDRNRLCTSLQLLLQFGSGNSRHGDVEDQTIGLV